MSTPNLGKAFKTDWRRNGATHLDPSAAKRRKEKKKKKNKKKKKKKKNKAKAAAARALKFGDQKDRGGTPQLAPV